MPHFSEITQHLFLLLAVHRSVFGQERVYVRVVFLFLSELFAFKGHRVTDLLRTVGVTGEDWSAWYRLFGRPGRMVAERLSAVLLAESLKEVPAEAPYVVGIDCTQVWRDSQRMEGTAWHKCARNPPWKVGIHRAQRFLNGSWLTPLTNGFSRAIPLQFLPAFTEKAVCRLHEACKEHRAGLAFLGWVRAQLDQQGRAQQAIVCVADGAYDKPDFWRALPNGVTALVRTAKNRALCLFPTAQLGPGRRRMYGDKALAPADYLALRTGWHTVVLSVRGRQRRMVYRVEGPFLRRTMAGVPLFLLVVRGQAYRRSRKDKYRQPAFYVVNAAPHALGWQLPFAVDTLLSLAWQRWELEVAHRELKTDLGLGDKQCSHPHAAVASVQWSAWVYAVLSLAAYRTFGLPAPLPTNPAWYPNPKRWTLLTVLAVVRTDLWNLPHFDQLVSPSPKLWRNCEPILQHLLQAARSRLPLPT